MEKPFRMFLLAALALGVSQAAHSNGVEDLRAGSLAGQALMQGSVGPLLQSIGRFSADMPPLEGVVVTAQAAGPRAQPRRPALIRIERLTKNPPTRLISPNDMIAVAGGEDALMAFRTRFSSPGWRGWLGNGYSVTTNVRGTLTQRPLEGDSCEEGCDLILDLKGAPYLELYPSRIVLPANQARTSQRVTASQKVKIRGKVYLLRFSFHLDLYGLR